MAENTTDRGTCVDMCMLPMRPMQIKRQMFYDISSSSGTWKNPSGSS